MEYLNVIKKKTVQNISLELEVWNTSNWGKSVKIRMKKTLFIFISLFFSFTVQANQDGERYFVTAKSGLIVRDAPNPTATKIAKIPHRLTVEVIEKSNILKK